MDFIATLDLELAPVLQALPAESTFDWQDIPGIRAAFNEMLAVRSADLLDSPHVAKKDSTVPGLDGAPEVPIRIYRPTKVVTPLPALVWMHGGGFVVGSIAEDDHHMQHFVEALGCLGVSVEYRLAPEHPFPAPLEDCYAALKWTHDNAAELGVDRGRLAVGGASAGGNLAAGLALLARDRGGLPIAFQWLIYPALDDRNITPSSHAITDARVWNRESNFNGWRAYLGAEPGSDGISPHAAPARATNLSGLPPTYIQVGSQDLFIDEDVDYAQRLARAGVLVELHVYPGAFHGSEAFVPAAALSQRMAADRIEALKRAVHPELAHPPTALAV
jgi:acetyl esterase/lipase